MIDLHLIELKCIEVMLKMIKLSKKILKTKIDQYNYIYVLMTKLLPTIILFCKEIDYNNLTEKYLDEIVIKLFKIIPNTIMDYFREYSDKYMDIAYLNIRYFIQIDSKKFLIPETIPDEIYRNTELYQVIKNVILDTAELNKC